MSLNEFKLSRAGRFASLKRRIEKLEKSYKANPLVETYSPTLSKLPCSPPVWSKFFRLKQAISRAREVSGEEVRVFAVEPRDGAVSSGKREFVIASYEEFWFYYSQMKSDSRHFYEVIEEGAVCHLYFDLEYSKIGNRELNGGDLTAKFVNYVIEKVAEYFSITITRKHVLELDSTNEHKFSRHLIIHFPNAAFRSNQDIGAFVTKICNESGNDFCVQTNGGPASFIDTGVYSKNRNFRLFLSSKKGKDSILKLHERCEFDLTYFDIRTACCIHHSQTSGKLSNIGRVKEKTADELIFYASLITNVKFHEKLQILTFSSTESRLKMPDDKKIVSSDSLKVCGSSPFPLLHKFVTSLVITDCGKGCVSKWVYFPSNKTIIFNISGNRFCGNIGRQHKSNHIYYVTDLTKKHCYQKCYDPVCVAKGYRSFPVPLPVDVLDSLYDDVEDIELISEAERVERENKSCDVWNDVSDFDLLSADIAT